LVDYSSFQAFKQTTFWGTMFYLNQIVPRPSNEQQFFAVYVISAEYARPTESNKFFVFQIHIHILLLWNLKQVNEIKKD
jgi:hypothetical protein